MLAATLLKGDGIVGAEKGECGLEVLCQAEKQYNVAAMKSKVAGFGGNSMKG